MLRFFRRIRKSLFDQKRFYRYLLYALGEVVLVVIGILIALQLNNSNEVRKQQEFALASFEELQKEIYTNLKNVHYFMGRDYYKDVQIRSMLCGTVDQSELEKYWHDAITLPFDASSARFEADQLAITIANAPNLPESYKPLIQTLVKLNNTYEGMSMTQDRLVDMAIKSSQKTFTEIPWFNDQLRRDFQSTHQEEGIDYLLNNPSYKAQLNNYLIGRRNLARLYYQYHKWSFLFFEQFHELNPEARFDLKELVIAITWKLEGDYRITRHMGLDSVLPLKGVKNIYKDKDGRYFSKSDFIDAESAFIQGETPTELIHLGDNHFYFPYMWFFFEAKEVDGVVHLSYETDCIDQELRGIQTAN